MRRNKAKNILLSSVFLLAMALPGCVQREKVYYLPKDQYPQIQRKDKEADLPVDEDPDDTDSVVLPFIPFEEEAGS